MIKEEKDDLPIGVAIPKGDRMQAKNVFTLLLRGRDQGSCAARLFVTKSAHVFTYTPVPALLFTLLTTSRDRS